MKKIVLMCAFAALATVFAVAQNGIVFKETVHDFGTISDKGGPVTHEFELTNNHPTTLVITDVKTSCGCTTPGWTKEPIEPGKTGSIKVTFNPAGYNSRFTKTITVHSNLEQNIVLQITGQVQREIVPIDHSANYPVEIGNYRVKKNELEFGTLAPDETKAVRIDVYNRGDKAIEQRAGNNPDYLSIAFGEQPLSPKKESQVNVTFSAAKAGYGNFKGSVEIVIDGQTQLFPYSASVVDNFKGLTVEEKRNTPVINFSTKDLAFADLKKEKSKTIKFSNSGKAPLKIHKIQANEKWIKLSKTSLEVAPGEIVSVTVSIDQKLVKEPFETILTVFSNDQRTPSADIKLTGKP
jgi:hypothetical protein